MKQKIIKVGNSLGVTIPADFVKNAGIKPGDKVEVKKNIEENKIVYKFSGATQLHIASSLFQEK
jgi:antitoxin component of MazEF toxin-antitoxin module